MYTHTCILLGMFHTPHYPLPHCVAAYERSRIDSASAPQATNRRLEFIYSLPAHEHEEHRPPSPFAERCPGRHISTFVNLYGVLRTGYPDIRGDN